MLTKHWTEYFGKEFCYQMNSLLVDPETDLDNLAIQHGWLVKQNLVVKPDQLFGKRGKNNLVLVDAPFEEVSDWIKERINTEVTIGAVTDKLTHFLIEEYVPHEKEYFLAIRSERDNDLILFSTEGGMEIEELWHSVKSIQVPLTGDIDVQTIPLDFPEHLPAKRKKVLSNFIKSLFRFYVDLAYTYLEINPFIFSGDNIIPLDFVTRLDDNAHFQCSQKWGDIEFPPPFGRILSEEESYIKELDKKSGASLKLSLLNPE
jgi:ATP-citrate lyase beta-subunit